MAASMSLERVTSSLKSNLFSLHYKACCAGESSGLGGPGIWIVVQEELLGQLNTLQLVTASILTEQFRNPPTAGVYD